MMIQTHGILHAALELGASSTFLLRPPALWPPWRVHHRCCISFHGSLILSIALYAQTSAKGMQRMASVMMAGMAEER